MILKGLVTVLRITSGLEKKLKEALSDFSTVEAAIADATEQLNLVKT
jgi:hypothetical protein